MNASEQALYDLLAKRYNASTGYALLAQVPNGTGANKRTTADAIAMQLYPSRGLTMTAFEFKASRGDWLKELKTPEKAEEIASQVHAFVVVTTKGVIQPGELPAAWGHYEAGKTALRTKKAAGLRDVPHPSWEFVAAIMRRLDVGRVDASALRRSFEQGEAKGRADMKWEAHRARAEAERRLQALDAFEAASGISIGSYSFNGAELGRDFKEFRESRDAVEKAKRELRDAARGIGRAHEVLQSVMGEPLGGEAA